MSSVSAIWAGNVVWNLAFVLINVWLGNIPFIVFHVVLLAFSVYGLVAM